MASKLVLLPTLLLALAFVTLCAQSFVFGGRPVSTSSLRSTARAAVPEALELQTSMTTALEVSTPGWWANIVTVVVPCAILIILYLQSEKRKYEEKMASRSEWPFLADVLMMKVWACSGTEVQYARFITLDNLTVSQKNKSKGRAFLGHMS